MKSRKFLYSLTSIILTSFLVSVFIVFAADPGTPFAPSDNVQDPGDTGTGWGGCGPTDPNCYVTVSSAISDLTAADSINTIDNGNYSQEWQWNTLSGNSGLKLSSNSTSFLAEQKLLEVVLNGENNDTPDSDPTPSYAGYFSNTENGIGVAVGVRAIASGSADSIGVQATGFYGVIGTGSGVSSIGLYGAAGGNSNTIGVEGLSSVDLSSSYGLDGYAWGASTPLRLRNINQTNGTIKTMLKIDVATNGTGVMDGTGGSIDFNVTTNNETNGGTLLANQLISRWTNGTVVSRTSEFSITGVNNAVTSTLFTISGNGNTGIGDTTPASMLTVGNGDLFQVASDGSIDAITGYIQGSGTMSLTSANTTQTTTSSIFAMNANSLTSGTGLNIASSTLTSGSLINLAITGTNASSGQKGINVSLSGANASNSQDTYGIYISNSHTGSPAINYGVYSAVSGFGYGVYGSSGTYIGVYGTGAEGVRGEGTSGGVGVYGIGTSGPGIQGLSTTGTAGSFTINPATTNSIDDVVRIARSSSGAVANGIGGSVSFYNETSSGVSFQSASIASTWTDVTVGTRTGDLEFSTTDSTTSAVKMTLLGNGSLGIGDITPDYLLDVEKTGTDGYIFAIHDSDGECLHDPEAGAETVTCSSDERLKTNIVDSDSVLEYLNSFRIRNYDVIASGNNMTGVIAQEVLENHPELVSMLSGGMYSVQLPNQWKLVKGIQELDIKLRDINDFENEGNSFGEKFIAWFASSTNGIKKLFVKDEICIGETCINEEQLKEILAGQKNVSTNNNENNEEDTDEVIEEDLVIEEDEEDGTIEESAPEEIIPAEEEELNEPEEIINQENEQTNEENHQNDQSSN